MPGTTPRPIGTHDSGRTDLGRRIATRREELGLSREELGSRSGVAASYIAYLEEQAASPAAGSLLRVAHALGTTVADLSGATTERPPGRGTAGRETGLVELGEAECRRLLSTHGIGRVALLTPEGPAILPVNYVVAGADVAFRTEEGSPLARAAGTEVAFEVDRIDDAMSQGWSVLVVGEAAGVTDGERLRGLDALAPSPPWAGGHRTHWMTVTSVRITGRRVVRG
ncbi:pyridoxamine 5'-phosphate oxidase family protein [Streptomyces sp. NPDC048577]|uniref:helix-turn-helix domain-containing protein n=1 Tax=Streptomyces sp. NPDC048577 TaxID=3157209 RepID=UPI0034473233